MLAGDWFDDSLGDAGNKDERLKLRASWFLEWAELERAFSKRSTSDVKAFMSCRIDNLRVPYGRNIEAFPRHCILVGTSNEEEFLADPTGDRRFWIVPVQKPIDCKLLADERDRLWAAAVALYRRGEQWWLNSEEAYKSQELNQPYHVEDPWLLHIKDYIAGLSHDSGGILRVYTKNILQHCLELDKGKQERAAQMRVAAVLKRLGFTKKPDSKGCSCWVKLVEKLTPIINLEVSVPSNNPASILSANQPTSQLTPTDTFKSEVSVPSNNAAAILSASQLIPTDTFLPTFSESNEVVAAQQPTPPQSSSIPGKQVSGVSVGVSNDDAATVSATDTSTDTCTDTSCNETAIAPTQTQTPAPKVGDAIYVRCLQDGTCGKGVVMMMGTKTKTPSLNIHLESGLILGFDEVDILPMPPAIRCNSSVGTHPTSATSRGKAA